MSDTSPSERARVAALANGDSYREEVLVTLAILKERSDRNMEWQSARVKWEGEHDKKDDIRFAALESKLDSKLKSVTSSIAGYDALKNQGLGMKHIIVGTLAFIGGLGGFIVAAIEVARWLKSP